MSAVEAAVEKVKALPEDKARKVLALIADMEARPTSATNGGASAALGFARRYRNQPRTTAEWMKDLREGER